MDRIIKFITEYFYPDGIIILLFIFLYFINLFHFTNNLGLYTLFNIGSVFIFFKVISKKSLFFERFLSFYLFMGFYVKFHFIEFFLPDYFLTVGSKHVNYELLLTTMEVSFCAFFAFLISGFISKRIFFTSNPQFKIQFLTNFKNCIHLYSKYHMKIYFYYFSLALFFIFLNLKYNIYSKGNVSGIAPIIIFIFKYFLVIGLPFIFLSIIHFDLLRKKTLPLFLILYNIFESFFISLSMVSRNLIINLAVFFVGYYSIYSEKNYVKKINLKFLHMALAILLSACVGLSLYLIEQKRNIIFNNVSIDSSSSKINVEPDNNVINFHLTSLTSLVLNPKIRALLIDRWVGIDAVYAVASYPYKNFEFFSMALREKDLNDLSFFDKNLIDSPYKNIDNTKKHFITVPGFVAFLFYPGSYVFLSFSIILFTLFGFYMEHLALKLSFHNKMLSAFIAHLIAYRFISFGYAPINSVIFFLIILLSLAVYYLSIKMIEGIMK